MNNNLLESTLRTVCALVTDGTHDTPKVIDDGYPLVKAKEIVGGIINFENVAQISLEDHLKVIARSKPEFGDTLFAHIGASLGEAAYINTRREFSIKNIALFKPDQNKIESRYLYYYIISPRFQQEIKNARTGSAQPFVGLDTLRNFKIYYHKELEVQRKIASILSAYDDLIENNTRRIKILEEMAQAIYREWFVNFRFPGHEKVKFVESPLGKIPEGWEVKNLNEISENYDSKRKPISSLKRKDMQGMYPYYGAAKVIDYVNDFIFNGKFLLIAEDGSVITKDLKPMLQFVIGKFWANNHTHILQGIEPVSTEFLFLFLSNYNISGHITGVAQPKINQQNLNRIRILIAQKKLMENFQNFILPIFNQINSFKNRNDNLLKTRDLLLPRLMSGEVDVEKMDIHINEE